MQKLMIEMGFHAFVVDYASKANFFTVNHKRA